MKGKNKDLIEISNMSDLRIKDSFTLQQEAIQLNRANGLSSIELGKRLIVLKEQCLKHTEFMKFVEEKLHLKYSTANKYMKVVRTYGLAESNSNLELVVNLGIKKSMRLLKISNLEERLEYIKSYDLVNKSYQEIDELLKELYPSEVKTLNEYSLYTNVHRSLQSNLKALMDNKSIVKDKEAKKEAKAIQEELERLIQRVEDLKSKFGKVEETEKQQAK